jgi:Cu/Zn superoxide dismutase
MIRIGHGNKRLKSAALRRGWARLGVGAASAALAVATLAVAAPAGASTISAARADAAQAAPTSTEYLHLHAMPVGTVRFGRDRYRRLTARVVAHGLTPGSSHTVELLLPGRLGVVRFPPLIANSLGQARATLTSSYTGRWWRWSRLVIRMGVGSSSLSRRPIAVTALLRHAGARPHPLISVEYGPGHVFYGTPRGVATISYSRRHQTLTVTVTASGVTPGPHAAHIHLGSCYSQGPVKYMLKDLVANRRGQIVHAVRVFTNVTKPIPAHGWYLNIHQGNSSNILSNGNPTIYFRPLLCADIYGH